jgi:hypothetical protein
VMQLGSLAVLNPSPNLIPSGEAEAVKLGTRLSASQLTLRYHALNKAIVPTFHGNKTIG